MHDNHHLLRTVMGKVKRSRQKLHAPAAKPKVKQGDNGNAEEMEDKDNTDRLSGKTFHCTLVHDSRHLLRTVMGKVKHSRQKLQAPAAKSEVKQSDNGSSEEMEVAKDNTDRLSVKKLGSVAGSKATSKNPFKGMKITTELLKQNLPDFDARSAITSKTLRGMNIKKKDKQRLRHELWMEKVDSIQTARKKRKEKRKQEKTVVVGDMSAMGDALPTLELLLKNTSAATLAREKQEQKPKAVVKEKQRQKQMLDDITLFRQVLDHPSYKDNPAGTIAEHLRNKLKQEEEQMDA